MCVCLCGNSIVTTSSIATRNVARVGRLDLVYFSLPLVLVWFTGEDVVLVSSAVVQVVCEGGQLHGQDHLSASEIEYSRQIAHIHSWGMCKNRKSY